MSIQHEFCAVLKEVQVHMLIPWEAAWKTFHRCSLTPFYLDSWKVTKNLVIQFLSINFCYLLIVSIVDDFFDCIFFLTKIFL